MTTKHTNALDHAMAEALHTAERVSFAVIARDHDGSPILCRAAVCGHGHLFSGKAVTALDALAAAMRKLRAAIGGAA